ncbi:hypothetical protein ACHAXA_004838 [Cyclostephanos tholiformis]|uniref:RNB domain-containing protein n=1 Tax=Cyclostephanos tholiformis TaxID=382380 RepID=A0ABD3SGR3_9STRA
MIEDRRRRRHDVDDDDDDDTSRILRDCGYGRRLVTIYRSELTRMPMIAEAYMDGACRMCLIVGLGSSPPPQYSSSSRDDIFDDDERDKPPLLEVASLNERGIFDSDRRAIDIGQITTLWHDFFDCDDDPSTYLSIEGLTGAIERGVEGARESLRNDIFPLERTMQGMYNGRVANRSRRATSSRSTHVRNSNRRTIAPLTKKDIPRVASRSSNPTRIGELLRNLLRVGDDRASRMVDSAHAVDYIYPDYCQRDDVDGRIARRIVAARALAEDASSGGRFRRRSCQFASARYDGEGDDPEHRGRGIVRSVTLVNGGWIAVDPSIRAASEGRKFASPAATITSSTSSSSNGRDISGGRRTHVISTAADERIARRLECLAMGDAWEGDDGVRGCGRALELDVREALVGMGLPLTSEGATAALVRIGMWSEGKTDVVGSIVSSKWPRHEPWSPEVLDAARSLARREGERRESLAEKCSMSRRGRRASAISYDALSGGDDGGLEGRVDLTSLPCVCIDAKRTTFRDDAIGIRLRSSTGRWTKKAASKWEVLVHIADVSDLYFDVDGSDGTILPSRQDTDVRLLREAAERRGQSRYDLPLGPLHLLPPVALTALSLVTNKENTINRCVTLWAYIDERDGRLIEAGLERTLISSPKALSFGNASALLDGDESPGSMSSTQAILSVAERNLSLWSQFHSQRNQAAQKREQRMASKELISKELHAASKSRARDDGVGHSFQRSRGHRMVDSSLDLYAFAIETLMSRAKQPIPRAAGSGSDRRGRLGTAPLRRYIDGLAQRQALSVLCGYGEKMTFEECRKASKIAARASDGIDNIRSSKSSIMPRSLGSRDRQRQVSALYNLARHLESTGGVQKVKAVSTGRNNEVVILGVGATGTCKKIRGAMKTGEKLLVQVERIDPEMGLLEVTLVNATEHTTRTSSETMRSLN